MSAGAVQHNQLAVLRGAAAPVLTRWLYLPDDPFTVTVAINTPSGHWVEWAFARDLLIDGLAAPAGIGDIRLWPRRDQDRRTLVVEIESPDGYACLEAELDPLEEFVRATMDAVPVGTESDMLDLDLEIAQITGSRAD
ncbi:MAG: SsgA family sporulation/cell division regulator [Pseudonocardiaceae bacterium]